MPKITITEDSLKGTFQIWDNSKENFVLSERNNINFSDDQIIDIIGENNWNLLLRGKFDFEITNKKLY